MFYKMWWLYGSRDSQLGIKSQFLQNLKLNEKLANRFFTDGITKDKN